MLIIWRGWGVLALIIPLTAFWSADVVAANLLEDNYTDTDQSFTGNDQSQYRSSWLAD